MIIDTQNDILHENGAASGLGVWKHAKEKGTIENIKRASNFARDNGIPVIYVKLIFREDFVDAPRGPLGEAIKGMKAFVKGTWGSEIVEELKPRPEDYVVEKHRVSAFRNTDLEILLRGLGKSKILFGGVVTNFCLEASVRDAADRDFEVIVLRDCTASVSEEADKFPFETVFSFLGSVTTSKELTVKK